METEIRKLIDKNGREKNVKKGFSWTSLFFGVFVPLVRGDEVGFILQLAFATMTSGLSWFVVPFFYNDRYVNRLMDRGYTEVQDTVD